MPHSYALAARAALLLRRALAGYGLLLALLLAGTAHAQAPAFAAATSLHPEGIYGISTGRATATDAAGNQYVTGSFTGVIKIGSTRLRGSGGFGGGMFVAKRSASTGAWLWAIQVVTSGNGLPASGNGIAVDGSGNLLVTGKFSGTISLDTGSTAVSLVEASGGGMFVAKLAGADGACLWAVQAGGNSNGIAVDGSGNALVTGGFQGTATFATAPTATSLVAATGGYNTNDVFVAKFAGADGACAWALRVGSSGADTGNGIAVDGNGNALVTGSFSGTVSFGTTTLVSALGYTDIFVAKFGAADGTCAWAVQAGGNSVNSYDAGTSIAVDGSDNALVTGIFYGTASFATAPAATSLVAAGTSSSSGGSGDVFVAKFGGANGGCAWAVRAGGSSSDIGSGIAVDGSGNALVIGTYYGTASFATTSAPIVLGASTQYINGNDVFVAKFGGAAGACTWAVQAGGTSNDAGVGIAVDGSDNALVTGSFQGVASFATPGDANIIPSTPAGIVRLPGTAMFAVRLDGSTGAWQAPAQANGGGTSTGRATAADAAGNQYVTGDFSGDLVLGSTTLVSAGNSDVFVAKRSASGAWLWAVRAGGSDIDAGYGIAVDGSGNVLVTGGFRRTASFGPGPTATTLVSANSGYSDVFVAKFGAADGACAWALRVGVTNTAYDVAGSGIAVDGSGNALVTGCFLGTVSFATSPAATTLMASAYNKSMFVAKYAGADGACAWAVQAGGARNSSTGSGIAVDGSGNALVTGAFTSTVSFATAPAATSLTSASLNYSDAFVAKFGAADGTCAWAVRAGGTGVDTGNGIAVDGRGNALVTGGFRATASFGTGPAAISLVAAGNNTYNTDVFVAKFGAADGACAWAVQAGGSTKDDTGYGITADGSGNALVTGEFRSTASFATSPAATNLMALGSNGNSYGPDVFVAQFGAADGACAWAVQAGGPFADTGYGIALDGSNNALLTGSFQSPAVFGSTTLVGAGYLNGDPDPSGFVASLPTQAAPVLTSVSPAAELPGQVVTLTGTGFTRGSTVSFGGVAAAGVSYVSPTSVTAVVPVGAGSTVGVGTAGGTTLAQPFTLLRAADATTLAAGVCTSATPVAPGPDSNWHYLLAGGQVVLAYNTQGLDLGTVGAELQLADPAAPVRTDATGRAYLGRNWHLTTSAGPFPGSTVLVRFYALRSEFDQLSATDPANVPTLAALRLTQYSGPNEDCELANDAAGAQRRLLVPATTAGPAGSNFFVAEAAVADHFSEFYLNGGTTPLPVQLSTFTASAEGPAAVRLAWATASEKNSRAFEVERSVDGQSFARLGTVAAAGSSLTPRSYELLDTKLPASASLLYYRLRQVDADGTFSYSPVRTLTPPPLLSAALALFPNPAPGGTATLTGAQPGAAVMVLDALGRRVASATATATGTAALVLPLGLPAGVYVVRAGSQALRLTVE